MTTGLHLRRGAVCLVLGLSALDAAEPTMPRAPYVLPQTVRSWQAGGVAVTFIDVREPEEFEAGHLAGAWNIPHTQIERRSDEITKDRRYVVYCIHSSWRAPYAANALADLGFDNVYVLDGGVSAWHAGGQAVHATTRDLEPIIAPYPEGLSRSLEHPRDRTHDGRRELTLAELAACDGMDGRPAYVALDGVVYDVTASRLWRAGAHDPSDGKVRAGRDLTPIFEKAPHGRENLQRFPVVGRVVARGGPGLMLLTEDTTWSASESPVVVTGDVSVAADVTLTIEAGVEVRFERDATLTVHGKLDARGVPENEIVWVVDGRPVLEIETPTLVARPTEPRETIESSPVAATDLSFDARTREIRYTLAENARVRARIGVRDEGPLLRTLLDWEPRAAGEHVEIWDGRDRSGRVDFGDRRDLVLVLACLPEHPEGRYLEAIRGRRKSPRLAITFPPATPTDAEDVPVLRGPTPVRVTIAPEDHAWLERMRFEVAMYVDTEFLMEHEEGNNPFEYVLDPASLDPGPHHITVNVIGFEGEIGTESVRIVVDDASD